MYKKGCNLCLQDKLPYIEDIVINYCSHSMINYSDWIDTITLNKYYYFIKNHGNADVEVIIEISPDRCLVYKDSDPIIINAFETAYLQPLRESRYLRFSYRNLNSTSCNLITSFFQGK